MNTLEIIFFILLSIVFYTYIGYGIILWILVRIKRIFIKKKVLFVNNVCREGNSKGHTLP